MAGSQKALDAGVRSNQYLQNDYNKCLQEYEKQPFIYEIIEFVDKNLLL